MKKHLLHIYGQLLSPYCSLLFCELIIVVTHYLGGTTVSWFLLKFTVATGVFLTASNTSSGIDASCFSLRIRRGKPVTIIGMKNMCGLLGKCVGYWQKNKKKNNTYDTSPLLSNHKYFTKTINKWFY